MTVLENDLEKARKHLADLTAELPDYHTLLTDSESDVQRLRKDKASLDAQVKAKARVQAAREMLETFQLDVQVARAEVVRLEAQERRGQVLAQMGEHAKSATKHRRELENAVHEGSEALGRALVTMAQAFSAIRQEREAFALVGRELAPPLYGKVPFSGSVQDGEKRAVCQAVLSELEARGATLTDVLNLATGRHTPVDSETRPLPTPEHSDLLWRVFSEAVAKHPRQRHTYRGVDLPIKPQPEQVLISPSGDGLPGGDYAL